MKTQDTSPLFLPKRLKLLRFYNDLTCQELADKTGLSKQAISKFETGDLTPCLVTMLGLCAFFEVPEDFFTKTIVTIKCTGTKLKLE